MDVTGFPILKNALPFPGVPGDSRCSLEADFAAAVPAALTAECLFAAVCWSFAAYFCYYRNRRLQTMFTDSFSCASLSFFFVNN